ncbi:hypothetical protein F2Q68_00029598 [Brassica cretica]|uniref:DUF1985 domain-containing protein n=1 Tax=Brassica cretica TaxID=69181 RepID=A0A8S9GEK5_BRACR|nr:hypothetical protein F2Q68_00029598 [Brassica cretica]
MRKPKSKKKVYVEDEKTPPQYKIGGTSSPDLRLPPRLFATDRFPTRRLNIYSSPDLFPFIRNVLRDTPELETIRQSCFGKLFDLPARQCLVSCKLIHAFLTRQLVCLPKNTLWSAFGGSPFRYGLEEFGTVTGLPCGSYPERYTPNTGKAVVAGKDRLVVTPIIPIESQPQPGWELFPDDVKDDSHGGVTSEPIIKKPKNRGKKKSDTIKQSLKPKQPSARKQRRISSYFTRSTTQSFTNVQLTEMVIQLSTQMKQLKCEMKRRKKRSHARQSSFNTLFSRRKQSNTPSHTPEPTRTPTDVLHNQDDGPMETDVLPQTTFPIISQYEAQLHRDSAYDPLASSPASDHCIHTRSVHVSPNHNNTCVHTSPDHNIDSRQVSPVFNHTPPVSQMITHPNDATDDYDEPPRTPVSVQPLWDELNSVVYDMSDHPNSPEINHILYHGVRIYDAINPDPPIFDSSIPRSRLLLSPQPKTMLTSPTKRNDSLSGFAVHATTVNAFTATASSNSLPSLALKEQNTPGVVDLTATKDVESHVPSLDEYHLANELSKSPLIHALTLISPLPGLEWDIFYNTISTKTNVYHTTPSSFDFSNKFLLDLAKPKQWTSTRVRVLSFQIPLNSAHPTFNH